MNARVVGFGERSSCFRIKLGSRMEGSVDIGVVPRIMKDTWFELGEPGGD